MHHDHRPCKKGFQNIVTVSNGIHAVFKDTIHIQLFGNRLGIKIIRCSRKSRGSQRTDPRAPFTGANPFSVAFKHPSIGKQMMSKAHRLCRLHVRTSRKQYALVFFRFVNQNRNQIFCKLFP